LPRQSPTLPRGLEGGNPLYVEIFLKKRKKSFLPECLFVLFDYFKKWILKTTEYT
jgi:hypothetical protein